MKFTHEYAYALISGVLFPALRNTGIEFKSESENNYKLIRYDDSTAPVITDKRIKMKLDIKKANGKQYPFILEIRIFPTGQLGLALDLMTGPIANHKKASKKLVHLMFEYDKIFRAITGAKESDKPRFIFTDQKI
jgi:hypothetical protein